MAIRVPGPWDPGHQTRLIPSEGEALWWVRSQDARGSMLIRLVKQTQQEMYISIVNGVASRAFFCSYRWSAALKATVHTPDGDVYMDRTGYIDLDDYLIPSPR